MFPPWQRPFRASGPPAGPILVAPLGTPPAIVAKVSADLKTVTSKPDLQAQLAKLGAYANPMDAAEANAFVNKQQAIWQPVLNEIAEQQATQGK